MPRFASAAVLAAVLVAMLAGCASLTKAELPPEERVRERAAARWDAALSNDWEAAYQLMTPGFREVTTLEQYTGLMNSRAINWTRADVTAVSCESAEKCTASVKIDYSLVGGMRGVGNVTSTRTSSETWLKLDDEWYHLPRRSVK